MAWPRSITLAFALLGSVVGHLGVAALDLPDRSEVELEVADGGAVAALGSSFEDLVSGQTAAPAPPNETTEANQAPENTPPVPVASQSATQPSSPLEETEKEAQQPANAVAQPTSSASITTPTLPNAGEEAPLTETGFLSPSTTASQPSAVLPPNSKPTQQTVTASVSAESLEVSPTTQSASSAPTLERLAPVDETLIAALPKTRPPLPDFFRKQLESELEAEQQRRAEQQARERAQAKRRQKQQKTEQAQRRQSAPTGNIRSSARRGEASGKKSGNAAQRGAQGGSRERASGSRDAANYPGKVFRKLARTRQPRVGSCGVARVSFSVTGSGGVSGVRIARSSGNARVDQAAVAHVQRAAPFPRPPQGAQTRFVIPIEFRK